MKTLPGGVELTVRLTPRASRTGVAGETAEALRITVQAPPLDDRANCALVDFLADRLACARSAVVVAAGARGRLKRVRVAGITAEQVRQRLGITG